ncbi:MAG: hypothetical protein ACI9NQ_000966 [Paracoccaceae bacterium]
MSDLDRDRDLVIIVNNIPVDTWVRFTKTDIIPPTDNDGVAVTHFLPLWSFQDVGQNSAGGGLMYMDDISFKVDVPFEEPLADLIISNLFVDKTTNSVSFNYPATIGANYAIERSITLHPHRRARWLG